MKLSLATFACSVSAVLAFNGREKSLQEVGEGHRSLQTNPFGAHTNGGISELWRMDESALTVDANGLFTVFFERNGVGNVVFEVFDTCPQGAEPANIGTAPGGAAFMDGNTPTSINNNNIVSPLEEKWTFTINNGITDYPGFSINTATNIGTASFCVRWGLRNGATGPLVNFRQSLVDVTVDMNAGFTTSFTTTVINPETDSSSKAYTAQAAPCNTGPYLQGQQVCIEVCPETADNTYIEVQSVSSLSVSLATDSAITQSIISGGTPVDADLFGATNCAPSGKTYCCQYNFLLHSVMFITAEPAVATVDVVGTAIMTTTRRGLEAAEAEDERALQEGQSATFATQIEILKTAENDSSSSTSGLSYAAAVAAVGAGAAVML